MKRQSRHNNDETEFDELAKNSMEFNQAGLDDIIVGCFLCHEFVNAKGTIMVSGKNDVRAHICLKHLKKLDNHLPLHQAL